MDKTRAVNCTIRATTPYIWPTLIISVKSICEAVGYSKSTVLSAFKKEFSTTVNSYLNTLRLERAKKMLENES
ncbi:MAG: helix-turn-helix domain-containing protein, partial [Clostridia bacterium]|nr:helix-turn-helix domain-containing protein [Clostridia bacterium]